MRVLLRRTLVALLAVGVVAVGLVVVAIVVVAATSFGAKQAIRLGAGGVPGELSVGAVDGSLYSGLELREVRYRTDDVDASVASLTVEPSVRDLIDRRLILNGLHVRNGRVDIAEDTTDTTTAPPNGDPSTEARVADAADSSSPFELPELPAYLEVRDLSIDDVEIDGLGTPIRVDRLTGSVRGGAVELDSAIVDVAGARLAASGEAMLEPERATGVVTGSITVPTDSINPRPSVGADTANTLAFDTAFSFDEGVDDDAWHAAIGWSHLEWRRPGAPPLASSGGRLEVRPRNGAAVDVSLRTSVEGEPLPDAVSLAANGAVSADTIDVERARIELAGAEAELTGAFRLDARSGYLSVAYRGIDPSLLEARMAGELQGRIDVALAAAPALRVSGAAVVGGHLDGRPLAGEVVASYADSALSIERGDVSLDGGRVVLDGMLSPDESDLRFAARLPRIGNWYPPITGSVTATGSISGDNDDPLVDLALDGENLAWEGGQMPALERVALRVGGTRAAHTLSVDLTSTLGDVALEAEQHYEDGRVTGRLTESVLEPHDAGTWGLTQPAGYSASLTQLVVDEACFTGPDGARLCATLEQDTLAVLARDVPTSLAEPWLPDRFVVSGTTDADVEVAFGEPLEASISLRQDALRLGIDGEAPVDDAVPLLDLGDLIVRASLDSDSLTAELMGGSASASSSLLAPNAVEARLALTPPEAEGRLDGFFSAQLTDLGALATLIDGIDGLSGVVDARFAVAGTLESPRVSGRVNAAELAAGLPTLGIDVTDGRFAADVPDVRDLETVPFDVELCSEGCARMTGKVALAAADDWSLTARVEGEDVLVVDLPEVRAVTTPQLEIFATPELATVSGAIAVPVGSIEVEDVPRSAVRPAPETVVRGRETSGDEEGLAIPLSVAVQASLGDVRFDGLGLEAQLDGTLDVEYSRHGDWIVQGTTAIEEGTFTAYGQTLMIEQGLLVFTGPPSNPQLDIRATRVVEDSEVSLAITGTAENPRSAVFSDAGLSESEAFARLLTGRSLDNLGESDPEALERAAIGLGLRRALPTLDRIGSALGLDELGVQSPGDAEGAVVAGRQIGDDVYVRYRHGLFDDFSGLELIYRITERFRLRTQTGTAQSIDLIYEVDPGDPDSLAEDVEDIDVAIQDAPDNPVERLGPNVDAE